MGRRRRFSHKFVLDFNRNNCLRSREKTLEILRQQRSKKPIRVVSQTEAEQMLEKYKALIFKSVFEKEDKPNQRVTASTVRRAARVAEIEPDELYAEARKIFVERLGHYAESIYEKNLKRPLTKGESQAFFVTFMIQQIRFRLLNFCRSRVAQKRVKEVPLELAPIEEKVDGRRKSFIELLGIPQDFSEMEIIDLFRLAKLDSRQREIVRLIQEGHSYSEIAQQLPISKSRVGRVVVQIRGKLKFALKRIEFENDRVGV